MSNLRTIIVAVSLLLSSCLTTRVELNYHEVNNWGREHVARITLLNDSTKYFGTGLRMTSDSTTWTDLASKGQTTVPSYKITKITFDGSLFPSFKQFIYSFLAGGVGFFAVGIITQGSGLTPLGFIAPFFISAALDQENVFVFYPDPIARQYKE